MAAITATHAHHATSNSELLLRGDRYDRTVGELAVGCARAGKCACASPRRRAAGNRPAARLRPRTFPGSGAAMTPSSDARTPRIRGVGAAAPALRVAGADIGAAWGRGGRDQVAACAPDEDTLTLAWDAATAALDAAG